MDPPSSCLTGSDRLWHINWLRKREIGQKVSLGYGNRFSKVLYSSILPHSSWEQTEGMRGVKHGGVFNLEFSPDGSLLVAACEKRSFLMFDALSHKQVHAVENAHRDCVNCVRFLDSRTFVTCSDDSTVALWDARNLKSRIRTLQGHSNWVKNIDYSQKDGLLVTSGFDGSIYTWDINSYTENGFNYERVFHTNGLMRTRLTPDASKMIICTTGGYLMIIHDLDLRSLSQDLQGFKPNMYRLMQQSQTTIPSASVFTSLFSKKKQRNRIEFVSDFPAHNDAEVVSSLQIHPQGWCALSRNISHEELSEWTCVHDIQDRNDDSATDSEELSFSLRDDEDDTIIYEGGARNDRSGFRGFPSDDDNDSDDADWRPQSSRRSNTARDNHPCNNRNSARRNTHSEGQRESESSSSSDSDTPAIQNNRRVRQRAPVRSRFHALLETTRSSSTTTRLLNDSSPLFRERATGSSTQMVSNRRDASQVNAQASNQSSNIEQRRNGNIRRLRISADGQVQMSDDDSSGEPASNVRVVEVPGSSGSSTSGIRRLASRGRARIVRSPGINQDGQVSSPGQRSEVGGSVNQSVPRTSSVANSNRGSVGTSNDNGAAAATAAAQPSTSTSTSTSRAVSSGASSRSVSIRNSPNVNMNAAAAVGPRQLQGDAQENSPGSQNMELHVASADVWEALVVIREARARRQNARSPGQQDRRDLIARFLRRLQDLHDHHARQQNAIESSSPVDGASTNSGNDASRIASTSRTIDGSGAVSSVSENSSNVSERPRRFFRLQRSSQRTGSRQAQAPAAIALGHFLRNPTPATRTLVMIAPNEGGAQNIHLRVSPNSFSYQSHQLKMPRNHKIHQNMPRLSHYIEEPNVGKGFIKELCFSSDGRVMCSPFSYGVRLLAFTPDCQEISTSVPPNPPVKLYELSSKMCHEDYVVSSKFSPTHCLLVSGCLKGKIVWHHPVL